MKCKKDMEIWANKEDWQKYIPINISLLFQVLFCIYFACCLFLLYIFYQAHSPCYFVKESLHSKEFRCLKTSWFRNLWGFFTYTELQVTESSFHFNDRYWSAWQALKNNRRQCPVRDHMWQSLVTCPTGAKVVDIMHSLGRLINSAGEDPVIIHVGTNYVRKCSSLVVEEKFRLLAKRLKKNS